MNFLAKEISLLIVSSEHSVILEIELDHDDDKLGRKFNRPNDKWKKPNKNVININNGYSRHRLQNGYFRPGSTEHRTAGIHHSAVLADKYEQRIFKKWQTGRTVEQRLQSWCWHVMSVTYSWWLTVGDNFRMLVTELRSWWHLLDVGARRLC